MGIACGIGAAAGYGFLPWYSLILPAALLICLDRKQLLTVTAAFTLCFASGVFNKHLDRNTIQKFPAVRSLISGEIFCNDNRLSTLPDVKRPYVLACKVSSDDHTFDANVIYPDNAAVFYGDCHKFAGIITPPVSAGLICENGRITGEMPPAFGNLPLIEISSFSPAEPRFSFMRMLYKCRDFILSRILSGIRNPATAEMASRLFMGASKGGSHHDKQNFIISGTIHLFSVSGLHVTLVALIILFVLRFLPFSIRFRVCALLVLFYVLASGASLPAVRAGTMFIIWCLMRSALFPSPSWNAMMYTWCAFVFILPETVASLSAQYSFGITAALLMLMEKSPVIFARQDQIISMIPVNSPFSDSKRKFLYIYRNSAMSVLVSITAFAAGAGISFYRQSLLLPGGIIANLLLILFTPVLFTALFFKLIAGALFAGCDQLGALVLEGTFHLLVEFTGTMADIFMPLPSPAPPLWSVAVYYLFFCAALGARSALINRLALIGTVAVLLIWHYPPPGSKPAVTVINYGSNFPAMLIFTRPGNGTALVADIPQNTTALTAGEIFKKYGIHQVQANFSGTASNSNRGLKHLGKMLDISIGGAVDKGRKPGRAFTRNLKDFYRDKEIPLPAFPLSAPDKNTVLCEFPGNIKVSSKITADGRKISVTLPDGEVDSTILPWCSIPTVWHKEIR